MSLWESVPSFPGGVVPCPLCPGSSGLLGSWSLQPCAWLGTGGPLLWGRGAVGRRGGGGWRKGTGCPWGSRGMVLPWSGGRWGHHGCQRQVWGSPGQPQRSPTPTWVPWGWGLSREQGVLGTSCLQGARARAGRAGQPDRPAQSCCPPGRAVPTPVHPSVILPCRIPGSCPSTPSPSSAPHPPHTGCSQQRSKGAPRHPWGAERKGGIQDCWAQGAWVPGSTPAPNNKSTELWGSFCTYLLRGAKCHSQARQSPAGEDGKGHRGAGSRARFPPGLEDTWPWHWPLQL